MLTDSSWLNSQRSPFLSTTSRFAPDHPIRTTPGPGAYAPESVAGISLSATVAARAQAGPSATFGATGSSHDLSFLPHAPPLSEIHFMSLRTHAPGSRVGPFVNVGTVDVPGPGSYSRPETPPKAVSSSFVSRVSRMHGDPSPSAAAASAAAAAASVLAQDEDLGFEGRDPGAVK